VSTSAVSPGASRLEVLDYRTTGAGLLLHNVRRDLHRLVVLLLRHLNLQLLHLAEVAGVGLRDRGAWGAWLGEARGQRLRIEREARGQRLRIEREARGQRLRIERVARRQRLRIERNPDMDVLT
jgi:hypothetical protein